MKLACCPTRIWLVDLGVYLHVTEILRDREQGRRLKAGRDGLPPIDITADHHAVARRGDHSSCEIDPRLVQLCAPLPLGRLGVEQVRLGHLLPGLGSDNGLLGDFDLGLGCAQPRSG
jgi:hypothetical protein